MRCGREPLGGLLLGLVLAAVRERLPDLVATNVPDLERSTLGDDAVAKGALASALPDRESRG